MHKNFLLTLGLLCLAAGSLVTGTKIFIPKEVHYHAGFAVFKDDRKVDFSGFEYMHVEPCTDVVDTHDSFSEIQQDKAHLHDFVGDVVHVHREGAKWRDLFRNIKYKLDYDQAKGFINNKEVENFETLPIKPYDSLVILIGENSSNHLEDSVTQEYIKSKEKTSEDCGGSK
jgi:hypothetical protein